MRLIPTNASTKSSLRAVLFFLIAATAAATKGEENWPRWRGPADTGSTEKGDYPVKWDAEKVAWKAALPGKGCSTPIVWERRIYLTAPTNDLDAVLAFDWAGSPLWQTVFGPENHGRHRNGSGSNPSPATDGKTVFVYFKSGTFAALELNGKIRWQTNLISAFGPDNLYWDHGTSPVLTSKYAIMTRMHHDGSWLAAFDKASGKMGWKVERNYETPVEGDHGYGTPLVIQYRGNEALLVWGAQHLTLHSADDGKIIWSSDGDFNPQSKPNWPTVASPVIAADVAVVASGRSDRGLPRMDGIIIGESAPVTGSQQSGRRKWKRDDVGTFVPTPAVYKGKVFVLRDRGEIECLDPASGKTIWSGAFPKGSSNFYASPVVAGGKLYAAREDGVVFVGKVDGGFEVLAENKMEERIIATPVPVSGRLFVRGEQHLFCIEGR